jgi:hypothetical protein
MASRVVRKETNGRSGPPSSERRRPNAEPPLGPRRKEASRGPRFEFSEHGAPASRGRLRDSAPRRSTTNQLRPGSACRCSPAKCAPPRSALDLRGGCCPGGQGRIEPGHDRSMHRVNARLRRWDALSPRQHVGDVSPTRFHDFSCIQCKTRAEPSGRGDSVGRSTASGSAAHAAAVRSFRLHARVEGSR